MGKNKKRNTQETPLKDVSPTGEPSEARLEATTGDSGPSASEAKRPPVTPNAAPVPSRLRRLLPDLAKVSAAFGVIALASIIWYQPPLLQVDHPFVSYLFEGKRFDDAKLYRPVAMPTRFYVELPHVLADRYQWFAIDRRREVAALAEEPARHLAGKRAIRRSDPLGLDLEFRKLDHSEWQVHFLDESIIFSNAVLCIRLDIKDHNEVDKK